MVLDVNYDTYDWYSAQLRKQQKLAVYRLNLDKDGKPATIKRNRTLDLRITRGSQSSIGSIASRFALLIMQTLQIRYNIDHPVHPDQSYELSKVYSIFISLSIANNCAGCKQIHSELEAAGA